MKKKVLHLSTRIRLGMLAACMKRYWMVKQEPTTYPWEKFVEDGGTKWTGVRNYQARNFLREMEKNDEVFYYHSVVGKEIVGIAVVSTTAFPDPTATEGDWSCVELTPKKALKRGVSLAEVKKDVALKNMKLLKQSRLSVMPVTRDEYLRVLELSKT